MLFPQVVTKGHSYSKNSTSRIWEAVASLCEWRGNYQVEIVRPPRDTCDKSRHLNVNSPVTHSSNTLIRVLAGINEQTGDISILIGKGRRFSLRKIRGDLFTRWLWVWANIVGGEIFGIKLGYRMLTFVRVIKRRNFSIFSMYFNIGENEL